MNAKRFFFVMIGVTVLLTILGITGVWFGNSLLQKQSKKLVDLRLQSRLIDEKQNAQVVAIKDIQRYADLERIAKTIVPQDKDQAKAVRELVKIADDSGITLASINFPDSSLGQKAVPSSTNSDTSSTTKTPATSSITQAKPVDGAPGLYQLQITLQSDSAKPVRYQNLIDFLSNLEQNRRTAQVSQLTITPDTKDNRLLSFTMQINIFIKP